jgi:CRISPR-associated protein Csb2
MRRILFIAVRFHDGRYHGGGDWPPAPARLFQALIAGAARGATLADEDRQALRWLEEQDPPVVAAPAVRAGQTFELYVPNNDLDAVGGDVRRVAELRGARKAIQPKLFDCLVPLIYAWQFTDDEEDCTRAQQVASLAKRLYQLGRGVDMAWATAQVVTPETLDQRLSAYPGVVHRAGRGGGAMTLACPMRGSLASLEDRFGKWRQRLQADGTTTLFAQPPKPRFAQVSYDCPPARFLFEIRAAADDRFAPWPSERATKLAERLRDAVCDRLKSALPSKARDCERIIVGRNASEADKAQRIRIVPLLSIGYEHVDRAIRRVLIEIPPNCPLAAHDIAWAFSGLEVDRGTVDPETGEVIGLTRLVRTDDASMLEHYGVGKNGGHRVWRSVTPVVLPESAARRRIDPAHRKQEAKGAAERLNEEVRASHEVRQALRHVGSDAMLAKVRVQREPFDTRGLKAETFAEGTRFEKRRLWHVEIEFAAPARGPLVIGDGRYLGLGLMAPVQRAVGVWGFHILAEPWGQVQPEVLTRALRRAVMARVQDALGEAEPLPLYFTGHELDGAAARRGSHAHIAFVADLPRKRLLVIAPHIVERRLPSREEKSHASTLDEALAGLVHLRAAGRLYSLAPMSVDLQDDPLFAPATRWESGTPYRPTRHAKDSSAGEVLAIDVRTELGRRNVPLPETIEVLQTHKGPHGGLSGCLRLTFKVAVPGPLLLGRTLHFGGGLFAASG